MMIVALLCWLCHFGVAKEVGLTLYSLSDDVYAFPALIGTPTQRVLLRLDFTSDDLWLFDGNLKDPSTLYDDYLRNDFVPMNFDSSESTSLRNLSSVKLLNYTDSGAYGFNVSVELQMAEDYLNIDGINLGMQEIGLANDYDREDRKSVVTSGIIGIGRLARSMFSKTFTLYSSHDRTDPNRLLLGVMDSQLCSSNWTTLPLLSFRNSTYEFEIQRVTLGNAIFVGNVSAVVSTTTTFIGVSPEFWKTLSAEMQTPNCSERLTAPPLRIIVPNGVFSIPAVDYIAEENGTCFWNIRANEMETDPWVLGFPFTANFCVRIDLRNQIVGLSGSVTDPDATEYYDYLANK